jgi:membrane-associated phospholipid phosphatase
MRRVNEVNAHPTVGVEPEDRHRTASWLWVLASTLACFVCLAVVAHRAKHGTALDHAVLDWLIEHRYRGLTIAAIVITDAGSPVVMTLLAVAAAVVLWLRHSPRTGFVIVATLAVATGLSTLTKAVVGAQRPPRATQLLLEVDSSYPSGHVTGTLALVGIVAVVIGRGRSPAIRAALGVAVVAATALVALTRLYLGVHWLTDVVGGSLLGGAAVLAGSATLAALTSVQSGTFGRRAESPAPKVTRVA